MIMMKINSNSEIAINNKYGKNITQINFDIRYTGNSAASVIRESLNIKQTLAHLMTYEVFARTKLPTPAQSTKCNPH